MSTKKGNKAKRQRLDTPVLTEAEEKIVLIQYKKDNNSANADAVLAEYLKFMHIKIGEVNEGECAPSKMIDAMWHAHILSTKEYFEFCQRCNDGKFIHHDPTMLNGQQRYDLTLKRYGEVYGGDPTDRNIWPLVIEAPIVQHGEKKDDEGSSCDEKKDSEDNSEDDEEDVVDSEEELYPDHDSWYRDGKGDTKKARTKWHQDFARRHGDNKLGCWTYDHSWIKGEYNVRCEDCRYRSKGIEDWYGDGKGNDSDERAEWHKRYALKHEDEEKLGPKHGDPNSYCGCLSGCKWRDGEYGVYCGSCREASEAIGSFSCG